MCQGLSPGTAQKDATNRHAALPAVRGSRQRCVSSGEPAAYRSYQALAALGRSLRVEVAIEIRPSLDPVAVHGPLRDAEGGRDLLLLHAAKVSAFDHLPLARLEPFKRFVEDENVVGIELTDPGPVGQRRALPVAAAPLGCLAVARVIDQNLPHGARGEGEEVGLVPSDHRATAEL